MRCSRCGSGYNERQRHGSCPHPPINLPDANDQIKRFDQRYIEEVPLMLGHDHSDPTKILGSVKLSAAGRQFFNDTDPLPLTLSLGAFQIGEVLVPVVFSVTHPPLDPIFGDVQR